MPTLSTAFTPALVPPGALTGAAAVIIDQLRASCTIARALDHGATRVIPVLEPESALAERDRLIASGTPREDVLLGGERGGILIPGFDLDNSPARYTREVVSGRTIIFTTTNGTRALLLARDGDAGPILIGCLNNLSATVHRLRPDQNVHLLCAGTRGEVSQEDVLCAGAITERLIARGFEPSSDDQTRIALELWQRASSKPEGIMRVLRESRGGRNLLRLGFAADIDDSARLDTSSLVPEYHADTLTAGL